MTTHEEVRIFMDEFITSINPQAARIPRWSLEGFLCASTMGRNFACRVNDRRQV